MSGSDGAFGPTRTFRYLVAGMQARDDGETGRLRQRLKAAEARAAEMEARYDRLTADMARHGEEIARQILAQKVPCPEHPAPLPKPSCWTCGRNGAFHRAARIALGKPEPKILTGADPEPPIGTVVRDTSGCEWIRSEERGGWVRSDLDGNPEPWAEIARSYPESWANIAGNYGPVTVISEPEPCRPCSLDYPVTELQALGWAQQAQWLLTGYYKFSFTFESYCTVAYPDDPEAHEVEARAVVSGDPGDFYRFKVGPNETLTWNDLCYVRTPDLVIRDNGNELIRIDGDDD